MPIWFYAAEADPALVEPYEGGREDRAQIRATHDLRRSCCQRLLDAGGAPLIVQRMMRHSGLQVTLAFYSRNEVQANAKSIREKLEVGHTLGHTS